MDALSESADGALEALEKSVSRVEDLLAKVEVHVVYHETELKRLIGVREVLRDLQTDLRTKRTLLMGRKRALAYAEKLELP
jgi:hypothetical protein